MSIPNKQTINVGLPNESTGSDSLYTAFTKTQVNFDNLFANASPYNTFNAGSGISTSANSNAVTITNTGVTRLTAGTGIILSGNTGNITISSTGGGNGSGGTVTSVGLVPVSNTRLTVTSSPVVSSGNISIDLTTSGVASGTYANPTFTVDSYGRVTAASNGLSSGTVTSVGLTPGAGIQINGGPITSNGNITVTNTGVTRLNAGAGIALSGGNGNVTVSATSLGGTVTAVSVSSSQLVVSGSPIVSSGTITINLPTNMVIAGNITANTNLYGTEVSVSKVSSNGTMYLSGDEDLINTGAANLQVTATHFTTGATGETGTLAAPATNGLVKTFMMVTDGGGDMVITVSNAGWKSSGTGTMTFNDIGDGCTLQYINDKWYCIGNNGVVFA
jgi:hypothetical protein